MELDYKKLGFKCGLEVHQRLQSNKLFCSCPSILRDDPADYKIKRRLRAVAGETGLVDVAAKHEMTKDLDFVYECYSDTTCLVEADEEPIHNLNQNALKIAIEIAMLLNCEIVPELHFMRKTVIDGSNTSGFQRTALLGRNGYIKTSKGKVRLAEVYLEEEAAKNVQEDKSSRTWRLDRLGIPLIEIKTLTDIKDPEHAKETALKIGMILRSTGKVMHGIGSIRQDVNISISKGVRTEIKGFQDIKALKKAIVNEVYRQLGLIKKGQKVTKEVRKANSDYSTSFLRPMPGSARMYPETDLPIYTITKDLVNSIKLPELITEKALRFEKEFNLNPEIARIIVKEHPLLFEDLASKFKKISADFIAKTLVLTTKDLKSRLDLPIDELKKQDFIEVLSYLNQDKISKEAIPELLTDKIKNKKIDLNKYKKVSSDHLENEIKKIITQHKGANFNALMGIIMSKFKGKIDGKQIAEILKRNIK